MGTPYKITTLEADCEKAVCTANVTLMETVGFPKDTALVLQEAVEKFAKNQGILDLEEHYRECKTRGSGTIINRMVKADHPTYYCSRAEPHPLLMLDLLEQQKHDLCFYSLRGALKRADRMSTTRRELLADRQLKRLAKAVTQDLADFFI